MKKLLLVGDPHVTPDALDDFWRLIGLVKRVAVEHKARVVFLGDQHHTHSMVRVEVMHAWYNALEAWPGPTPIMLVGNHDMPGTEAPRSMHALIPYKGRALVVEEPAVVDRVAYMPYYKDPAEFKAAAAKLAYPSEPRPTEDPDPSPRRTLVCHQTFVGAMYENNFPAPDGVQLDEVPFEKVYSGHIHLPQKMGKLTYPGSPRWRTVSDANIARSLLLLGLDDEGRVVSEETFETEGVCKPIYRFLVSPQMVELLGPMEVVLPIPPSEVDARIIVDIEGPAAFCDEVLKVVQGDRRIEIRVRREAEAKADVKESEGIASSLKKFVAGGEWGVEKEVLWQEVAKRTGLHR